MVRQLGGTEDQFVQVFVRGQDGNDDNSPHDGVSGTLL